MGLRLGLGFRSGLHCVRVRPGRIRGVLGIPGMFDLQKKTKQEEMKEEALEEAILFRVQVGVYVGGWVGLGTPCVGTSHDPLYTTLTYCA